MVTIPCYLLYRDLRRQRWLVCFNRPEQNLTPNDPVYLPDHLDFQPIDERTGEFRTWPLDRFASATGFGLITVSEHVADHLPDFLAREIEAQRREELAEWAEAERKRKASARAARREADQQIRALKTRKSRKKKKPD